MKKVITAIGDPVLNKRIEKDGTNTILCKDIQYREGVLEFLEDNINVNIIIIKAELPGEIEVEELIEKINQLNNKIEFYIICENKNLHKFDYLKNKAKVSILKNEELDIEKLISFINCYEKDGYEKVKKINKIKEIYIIGFLKLKNFLKIINKKIFSEFFKKINKNIFNNLLKLINNKIINNFNKNKKRKNKYFIHKKYNKRSNLKIKSKIISFCGVPGVGKTINIIVLAQYLEKMNKKVLIIDFDLFNKSISTILGIKKNKDIKEDKKINKNLYFLSGENLIENSFKKINLLKNKFDYILIDNNFLNNNKYIEFIFKISDEIFFLIEPNLIEIEKSKKLLEEIKLNFNLNNIKIILNKVIHTSTSKKNIEKLFYEEKIIGQIKFNDKYNLIINKNNRYYLNDYKEFEKIIKK